MYSFCKYLLSTYYVPRFKKTNSCLIEAHFLNSLSANLEVLRAFGVSTSEPQLVVPRLWRSNFQKGLYEQVIVKVRLKGEARERAFQAWDAAKTNPPRQET